MNQKKVAMLAVAAGLGMATVSGVLAPTGTSAAPVMEVSSVTIEGNQHWSEGMIRRMVPSLKESQIDVSELSRELQLVNDTNAANLMQISSARQMAVIIWWFPSRRTRRSMWLSCQQFR